MAALMLGFGAVAWPSVAQAQPRQWAVVIGVNEYLDPAIPDLRYCVADARRLAQSLVEDCGYDERHILVLTDDQPAAHLRPLRINLQRQIANWLANCGREDSLLVAFSGHGFVDSKTGLAYLAASDTEQDRLEFTGFAGEALQQMLRDCQAQQKLLILDCCHAGAVKSGQPTGVTGEELCRSFLSSRGLVTLASSRRDEFSYEWRAKGQGLFTYYLVKGLGGEADNDGDGVVTSDELYHYLYRNVPLTAQRELNGRQTPVRVISPETEGVFAIRGRVRPVTPVPIQPSQEPTDGMQKSTLRKDERTELINSIGMKLVPIPEGSFMMGSPKNEVGNGMEEWPQHHVTISRSYFLGAYEVTQDQYERVMGVNPSFHQDETNTSNHPVENVTWRDAVGFCERLSQMPKEKAAGRIYRLPTEAEWEYACRAGSETAYCFGDDKELLKDFAWYSQNRKQITHAVGQKYPNAWGMYDMHGNVLEWCADWFGDYPEGAVVDPRGPTYEEQTENQARTLRGGCVDGMFSRCRSAARDANYARIRTSAYGFRVAMNHAHMPSGQEQSKAEHDRSQSNEQDVLGTSTKQPLTGLTGAQENSVGMKFARIPRGTFTMGSPSSEEGRNIAVLSPGEDREPRRRVTISNDFLLGVCEVTQGEFRQVMDSNPSSFKGSDDLPVEGVTWTEATEFCKRLSSLPAERSAGHKYRLPTEAEWEYACRAGSTTAFSFGDSVETLTEYSWFADNASSENDSRQQGGFELRLGEALPQPSGKTFPVGQKRPNAWGLYDMHGNVFELCADNWSLPSNDPATDPLVLNNGQNRVYRGGAWNSSPSWCRSAARNWLQNSDRFNFVGFRVVLEQSP